jgi:hypothetical protein
MGCERENEEREEDSGEEALLRSRCTTYFFVFEILAATASDEVRYEEEDGESYLAWII